MNKIKTIIVDDEILARKRIRKLLISDNEMEIVGEFEKGIDAIKFINSNPVDIVFLDIHMPEVDGFSVLSRLSPKSSPFVIFATADKQSAIKAFEYNAIDYLLKPFRNSRFQESLKKAKDYVQLKNKAAINDQLSKLLVGSTAKETTSKIQISQDNEVDFNDILYVSADGNYLKLYENENEFRQIRLTLNELTEQLEAADFIRIHRSILVNNYFIESIKYIGNNEYEFQLTGSIILKSGRSYKAEIEASLTK